MLYSVISMTRYTDYRTDGLFARQSSLIEKGVYYFEENVLDDGR
jgi:hypothetical protein